MKVLGSTEWRAFSSICREVVQVTANSIQEITRLASDDVNSNRSTCLSKLDLCIINLNSIRNRISADQCRTIEHSIENLWHSFLSDNSTVVLTNFRITLHTVPPNCCLVSRLCLLSSFLMFSKTGFLVCEKSLMVRNAWSCVQLTDKRRIFSRILASMHTLS